MGYGDDIMATGLARGFKERGKLAAFGDGKKIIWGPWSEEMFRYNPNIANPDQAHLKNVEWVPHYKGKRMYNKSEGSRWKWNYNFKVKPGQFYFNEKEVKQANAFNSSFIVIEPNVPWQKKVAGNKDWGEENYFAVAKELSRQGHSIVQFVHKNARRKIPGAVYLDFQNFRDAIAVLSKALLYIGPEGGMHHASAAVGTDAVVIMGGFIPPEVVGYDNHINLTGGVEACGNIEPCVHCRNAMKKITVELVVNSANSLIERAAA